MIRFYDFQSAGRACLSHELNGLTRFRVGYQQTNIIILLAAGEMCRNSNFNLKLCLENLYTFMALLFGVFCDVEFNL
jgi:hypothetical protein